MTLPDDESRPGCCEIETALSSAVIARDPVQWPRDYEMREDGLWFAPDEREKGRDGRALRLSGPFEVLATTRGEDGNDWGLLLRWRDPDQRIHHWAMPRAALAGDQAEVWRNLLSGGLFVANGAPQRNRLADALNSLIVRSRALAIGQTGWAGARFVLPHITFGEIADERVVFQGGRVDSGSFDCAGTIAGWQAAVGALAIGNDRLMLALSAAFAGPLLSLIEQEGGGVHFMGDSSTGKTTALRAAASVWGPANKRTLSWRATANGLEAVARQHSETLLCLDELAQLDAREAGHAAYMLANGQGKARMRATGDLREQSLWRIMFLSTGETGLAALAEIGGRKSAAGQEVRILELPADAGAGRGMWTELHGSPDGAAFSRWIGDAIASQHGTAAPQFLTALTAGQDEARTFVRAMMDRFLAAEVAASDGGMARRAAQRFALIGAAGELARSYGVLPWPEGAAMEASARMLESWVNARGGTGASEERAAVQAVRDFIERNPSRFEAWELEARDKRPIIGRAGWLRVREQRIEHLLIADAWGEIARFAGLDGRRIAAAMSTRGMLQKASDGKAAQSVLPPGGVRTRVYVVWLDGGDVESGVPGVPVFP